jgi:hypothetical protein
MRTLTTKGTMGLLPRTGVAILAAAVVAGCGAESDLTNESAASLSADVADHNPTDHIKYTIEISETNLNPCNGELVQLAGTVVGHSQLVGPQDILDPDRRLHEEIHEVVSETGVGLTTGATYTLRATFTEGWNTPDPLALNATYHERQKIRVMSTTPGLTYTALATIHIVTPPSGESKITRFDEDHFVCAS